MARFTAGWIKLHRKVIFEDIGDDGVILAVWTTLLCFTNWQASKRKLQGQQILLEPGMVVTGSRELAEKLKFSKSTVHRALKYLEKTKRISIQSGTQGSIITICNYTEYQSQDEMSGTPTGHQRDTTGTPTGHEPNHNEESKNKRKKNINKGIHFEYPTIFIGIWESYGKIGSKKKALLAFNSLGLSEEEVESLRLAIKNYLARKPEWQAPQHFSTFLNCDWRQYLEQEPIETAQEDYWQKVREGVEG